MAPPGKSRRRYLGSAVVMTACLGGILTRLFFVQGVDAARYAQAARNEYVHEISFLGERGAILDRNGDELAMSVPLTTVYSDDYQVTDPRLEAHYLSGPLGVGAATLQSQLSEASGFVYLAHTIPDAQAAKVTTMMTEGLLPGIYTMQEPKRFLPAGQLALPLIGQVGTSGQGLSGLEYKYNRLLEGKPGKLIEDMDPAGGLIPGGVHQYQAPVRGDDLVLSIDKPLQFDAEQALARALVAAQAQSGIALIMDSKTGELLAVAQLTTPSRSAPVTMHEPPALPVWFVPQNTSGISQGATTPAPSSQQVKSVQPVESPSATAFTSVYEPGSVEKLVTLSGALQSGSITPTEIFSVPNTYDVAGTMIADAWTHPTLYWTPSSILAHSSDIGTVEIAQKMGLPVLLHWIHAFGIGRTTDVNFPGESAGLVPGPTQWSGTSIATMPIGQGLAVTAVQMLDAYNTIANGGLYIAPRLVDGYVGARGHEHWFAVPKPHRVVSRQVAADMTSMLEGVVRVGTGGAADLSPYTVAGKTGTALVPSPKGGYIAGDFVSSFAGFVPAEDPAVTAMVVVEGTHQYGAEASAPVFAMLARDALQELGVPPHKTEPPVPGVPLASAYGGEGEAAGPALPGLTGTPDVRVSVSGQAGTVAGGGSRGSGHGTGASTGGAATTTSTAVGGAAATTTTPVPATSAPSVAPGATTTSVATYGAASTTTAATGAATTGAPPASTPAVTTTAPLATGPGVTTTTVPLAAAATTTSAPGH